MATADVAGTVQARLPLVALPDNAAAFGAIGAFRTKTSTDTITVRASRLFDRRLDKKVQGNDRWSYQDDGSDDTDRVIPGLPWGITSWNDDITDRYYAVKFQFLFQWAFTVRGDTSGPIIGAMLPVEATGTGKPAISASYQDSAKGGGIDTRKIALMLDGVDVTAGAKVGASAVSYTPARALQDGEHEATLSVANRAGKTSTANWSFLVDTRDPVISSQSPNRITNASPNAVISAVYADGSGSGVDLASVALSVDGVDVTAAAVKSVSGIKYTPSAKLAGGQHRVVLKLRDNAGNSVTDEWTFGVDARGVTITAQAPADDSVLPADSRPAISASFTSTGSEVVAAKTVLLVDGVNVTAKAKATAAGISYTPATALTEGEHSVSLTVTDKRQYSAESRWTFTTRSAPEFGALAPLGIVPNTPSALVISAAYRDTGSGVDPARTRMLVDGVDFSAQARITATGLTLAPAAALPQGEHVASLTVTDKAGNTSATTWRFTIDSGLPAISGAYPRDTVAASARPAIGASYADGGVQGSGINPARVRLLVDGMDVTKLAQVGASAIAYQPAAALQGGLHTVTLQVADNAGNVVDSTWSFTVDVDGPVIAPDVTPADGSKTPANVAPLISARYQDGGAGVDTGKIVLELDGRIVTAQAQASAMAIQYTPAQALAEGAHTVRLTVADLKGNTSVRSWTFTTAGAPAVPPVITLQSPNEEYVPSGSAPAITASYSAKGAPVDLAKVRLYLDDADVTAQAAVGATGVRYVPAAALADGTHQVRLVVADTSGATAESLWRFGVASPPVLSALTPKDVMLPAGSKAPVSVQFQSGRAVDRASVRMYVDSTDVTARAVVGANRIDYTPAQAYAAGPHNVYVAVTNAAGATAEAFWGFDVAAETVYKVTILTPAEGTVTREPVITVSADTAGSSVAATSITVNGVDTAYVADGDSYHMAAKVPLAGGDNTLQVTATYADGATRMATAVVTYDAPPVIAITSPLDKATLGAVNASSPRDLTGNVERPVTITGTVTKPVASVTINQQMATLAAGGREFSFPNFFLHEGINLLSAVATDASGRTATASVTVTVDQTAPILNVEGLVNGAVTSAARIDVRGVVNDAVEGWTDVPYAAVTVANNANGKAVVAKVSDRFYIAEDLPLEVGSNVLRVTARDHVGNSRQVEVTVTRIAAGSNRVTLLSGNRQRGALKVALPQPLAIVAIAKDGNPLANRVVTFDVLRGTGSISRTAGPLPAGSAPQRNLAVTTDAAGRADVWLTLGKQSGEAGNVVRASAAGIGEEVLFTATGEKGLPAWIRADAGVTQFGETGATALEPLSAVVTDSEENRVPNLDVVFTVEEGDAYFVQANGTRSATLHARTDKNGMATARPTYGTAAGTVRITAKAINPANQAEVVGASYQMSVLEQRDGPTRFAGKVLSHDGRPLPGVRLSIGRTSLSATADENGNFSFAGQVPPGKIDLFVDGRTANVQTSQYPALHFEALAVRGQDNVLPHPIYLPALLMSEAKIVGGNQDVTLKIPGFDGFEMVVKANSVTFPDGSRTGPLVVSPVQQDRLPMVPPGGYSGFMSPAWTIQPSGTRFDPPIQVKVPNSLGLKPGETREIFQWDHDLATFVPMGRSTVSEDGALLVSDVGSGVSKAGWGGPPNPPPDPPKCGVASCWTCQMKNPAGQAPCCIPNPDKEGDVVGTMAQKLSMELPLKEWARTIGQFVGLEMQLVVKGEIALSMDDTCCAKKEKGGASKYAVSGVIGGEGELAVPLLPILKKIPLAHFVPAADAFIPHVKLKLSGSIGAEGSYSTCVEQGAVTGKASAEFEVDALSLSNKYDLIYSTLDPSTGTVTRPGEITLIEIGGLGNGSASLNEWSKIGIRGERSWMFSLFVRFPAISIGTFNLTLGEVSMPIGQGGTKFLCPRTESGIGECKDQK